MQENFPPLMAITFDDGFKTDVNIAYPYMESRGIKGTSYFTLRDYSTSNYMNWRDVIKLKASGWDVNGHFSYVGLSEEELLNMFDYYEEYWNRRYFTFDHHAAHFTHEEYREPGMTIAAKKRKTSTHLGSPKAIEDYKTMDFSKIRRTGIDTSSEKRFKEVCDIIDEVVKGNRILISYFHEIVDVAKKPVETEITFFKRIIDYAIDSGIKIVTVSEMYRKVQRYRLKNNY